MVFRTSIEFNKKGYREKCLTESGEFYYKKHFSKSKPGTQYAYSNIGAALAAIQSGAIGAQSHIANGFTALFIACGRCCPNPTSIDCWNCGWWNCSLNPERMP